MRIRISSVFSLLATLVIAFGLGSCRDDLFYDPDEIGEGEATVRAQVSFLPMMSALTRTDGNAVKNIDFLTVLIYDRNDRLVKVLRSKSNELTNLVINQTGNGDMPPGFGSSDQAEQKTPKAEFEIPALTFGRYRFYAVANVDITDEEAADIESLKQKQFGWDTDISKDNQMFGYFRLSTDTSTAGGFDAPLITINNTNTSINCWLRRLVSKVTVAYDPSQLHQQVFVYINKVTVKDIPKSCTLGQDNTPTSVSQLITDGESIHYNKEGEITTAKSNDFENWMRLDKGSGIKGSDHSETAQALFFFENMQGDYSDHPDKKKYDKRQDPAAVGDTVNHPSRPDYKDEVRNGTYVEVEGFYVSTNPANVSSGPIKYRFMLGKDLTYNYNAQRNHHYKLTLRLRGWANQADWHIDYVEDNPGMYTPEYYYVSYLYNTESFFPVKLNGKPKTLTAEIIENNWAPFQPGTDSDNEAPPAFVAGGSEERDFRWNRATWAGNKGQTLSATFNKNSNNSGAGTQTFTAPLSGGGPYNGRTAPYLGFLALKVPDDNRLPDQMLLMDYDFQQREAAFNALESYYVGNGQNKRVYDELATEGKKGNGYNAYYVSKSAESTTVSIPLWTRPKTMITNSGFTGNNPYDYYQRKAVVRFTATFDHPASPGGVMTVVKEVPILQVRRIVNPKAVWRSVDNNEPFHVLLMRTERPGADFTPFSSEGEWKAYVTTPAGGTKPTFVSLSASGGSYMDGDTVKGNTGTHIDFMIDFKGSSQACGAITVEYHGYTCTHRIFVRKGYNYPVQVADKAGAARWSSFSLFSVTNPPASPSQMNQNGTYNAVVTCNPLSLGTFFKRGNLAQGILVKNNNTSWGGPLDEVGNNTFELSNGNRAAWSSIQSIGATSGGVNINWHWPKFRATVKGNVRTYRVPTYSDFEDLLEHSDFGWGILYADGAEETQSAYALATGFQDTGNTTVRSEMGVRGCVVYNRTNYNQIFFSFGKMGMARRQQFNCRNANYRGELRYGDVYNNLDWPTASAVRNNGILTGVSWSFNNQYRPIPYNMPYATGGLYWFNQINPRGKQEAGVWYPSAAWDFNYFSFDFGPYTMNCLNNSSGWGRKSDALPIKLVLDE